MDKDRIAGAAKQAKGAVKEVIGICLGHERLKAEGKSDKLAGRIQYAIGSFKDALRG